MGYSPGDRDALLAGLVIDGRGGLMTPSRTASQGASASRYYVGPEIPANLGAPERIPAARLESSVVAMLRRVRLIDAKWRREDLHAALRRVVVLENAIVLQLEKRVCLTLWRAQEPILQRLSTGDVLRLVGTCMAKSEEISEAGTAVCIKIPRHSRARKIRRTAPRSALLFQTPAP